MDRIFRLYMSTENAAFGDSEDVDRFGSAGAEREAEIVRILREVANKIEREGVGFASRTIHDVNGNDVGRYAVKTQDQWNH